MAPAPYRLLRHTADLRLSLSAPDFPALCARGALSLASLVADRRLVRPSEERVLAVPGGDPEEALLAFLRQVLALLSVERFLVRSARVLPPPAGGSGGGGWRVLLRGEEADASRHRFAREVKAVTRHAFEVARAPGGALRAKFVVDV